MARLASTMKTRQSAGRSEKPAEPRRRRRSKKKRKGPKVLVKTVVATTGDNEAFGWQVAAEVHRCGLDRAERKACVCDGSQALWALFGLHLLASGFLAILDFIHLLTYLYAAAGAVKGKGTSAAWVLYERWLRLAWSGEAASLLAGLRDAARRAGGPPAEAAEDDPRRLLADAVTYVTNNRGRMDYPRYRRLGLPIFGAGGEHDQAGQPADQREREVLATGRGGGRPAGTGRLPEPGRPGPAPVGPAPAVHASVGAKRLRPAA